MPNAYMYARVQRMQNQARRFFKKKKPSISIRSFGAVYGDFCEVVVFGYVDFAFQFASEWNENEIETFYYVYE